MLACVDVAYGDAFAVAGCVLFESWTSQAPVRTLTVQSAPVAPYQPGEFYLRELPPLMDVLSTVATLVEAVVVDGYVWLGGARPGLGARLFAALGEKVPVVGVAKTAWGGEAPSGSTSALPNDPHRSEPVLRGQSVKPLFVTAAGIDVAEAAAHVAAMHGANRMPTLLKAVDRLVRDEAARLAAS